MLAGRLIALSILPTVPEHEHQNTCAQEYHLPLRRLAPDRVVLKSIRSLRALPRTRIRRKLPFVRVGDGPQDNLHTQTRSTAQRNRHSHAPAPAHKTVLSAHTQACELV